MKLLEKNGKGNNIWAWEKLIKTDMEYITLGETVWLIQFALLRDNLNHEGYDERNVLFESWKQEINTESWLSNLMKVCCPEDHDGADRKILQDILRKTYVT